MPKGCSKVLRRTAMHAVPVHQPQHQADPRPLQEGTQLGGPAPALAIKRSSARHPTYVEDGVVLETAQGQQT
jgi:hypothetical protein